MTSRDTQLITYKEKDQGSHFILNPYNKQDLARSIPFSPAFYRVEFAQVSEFPSLIWQGLSECLTSRVWDCMTSRKLLYVRNCEPEDESKSPLLNPFYQGPLSLGDARMSDRYDSRQTLPMGVCTLYKSLGDRQQVV